MNEQLDRHVSEREFWACLLKDNEPDAYNRQESPWAHSISRTRMGRQVWMTTYGVIEDSLWVQNDNLWCSAQIVRITIK